MSAEKIARLLKKRQNIDTPGFEFEESKKKEEKESGPEYEWDSPMNEKVKRMLDKMAEKWYKPYEARKQTKDRRIYQEFGTENESKSRKALTEMNRENVRRTAQNRDASLRFMDAMERQRLPLQPVQAEENSVYQIALEKAMNQPDDQLASTYLTGGSLPESVPEAARRQRESISTHQGQKQGTNAADYDSIKNSGDYEKFVSEGEKIRSRINSDPYGERDEEVKLYYDTYMSEAERDNYNYLLGSHGKKEAENYYKTIEKEVEHRGVTGNTDFIKQKSEENPMYGVSMNMVSSLGSPAGYLSAVGSYMKGEDIDPNSRYFGGTFADSASREGLKERTGAFGDFMIDTGLSMGQTAMRLPLGNAGLAFAAGGAASNTLLDSLERGGSDGQALANATLAGGAEAFFEKFSLDGLEGLKMSPAKGVKEFIKNLGRQALTEGSEEVATEFANTVSDGIIMGELSTYNQEMQGYIANGMDKEEAKVKAYQSFLKNMGLSGLGGALSGGIMGGGSMALGTYLNRNGSEYTDYQDAADSFDLDQGSYGSQDDNTVKSSHDLALNLAGKEQADYPVENFQKGYPEEPVSVEAPIRADQLQNQENRSAVSDDTFRSEPGAKIGDYAKQFGEFGSKAFEKNYTPDIPMDVYDKGFKDAYNAGRYNEDYRTVDTAAFNALPGDAGIRAFEAGLADRNKALNIDLKTGKPKTGGLLEASETAPEGMKKVAEQLGKKTGLKFIIADILPYDANGMYEGKKGQVYISTNTDNFNSTAAHELTHFIRDYAPESYQSYQDVVARAFAESQSTELEAMIGAYADNYSKTGVEMTRDEIMDEIVADATANFMNDEEFVVRIADQDKTLAQKIVDFFTDIVDAIKAMISRNKDSKAASILEENLSNYEAARDIWYDALEEASRKNKAGMEAESKTRYQLVGTDEDGVEIYETNEDTKILSVSERKKLLLNTVLKDYAGRTAKFTKDGVVYYAIFDGKGMRKGIYGDKKSDSKGFEAKVNIGADGNYFELVENSLYSGSSADSGKVTSNYAHVGVKGWDYYVKTIKSDGNYYDVLINVRDKGQEQYVYDVSLKEKKQSPQAARQKPALIQGDSVSENSISKDKTKSNTDFQLKGFSEEVYNELLKKYGAIEKGVNPVRDIQVPKRTGDKDKVRQTVRTILESDTITDEMVEPIQEKILDGSLSYQSVSDDSAKEYADTMLKNGFDYAMRKWEKVVNGDRPASKNDIALAERLLKDAAKAGDTKTVLKLTSEIAAEGTRAGQTVQALSMMKNLKKAGIAGEAKYFLDVEKELNKDLEKRFRHKKEQPKVKLNEELVDKLNYVETDLEREAVYGEIFQDLADQLPSTWVDKWNAWRYLSMLGNPRTHIRNIVGNAVFVPAVEMKNAIGAQLENMMIKDGERTKASRIRNEYKEFARKDFINVKEKISAGGKMNPTNEVTSRRKIFKTRWLEFLRTGNTNMLEKEDAVFLNYHYNRALSGYLQANNINLDSMTDTQLERARMYAIKEAQKATYRDASAVAEKIQKLSDTNMATQLLVEGALPFKKTPINILKRGVEYSPAGLLASLTKGVNDLNTGKINQNQFIDGVSSGLTGTVIMAVGILLANLGLIRGAYDDEDDKTLGRLTGDQEYSVKIGKYTYTIDWTVPASLPLFVGCEIAAALNGEYDQVDVATILDAMSAITEPMFNLSMLSGLNDTIEAVSFSGNKLEALGKEAVFSYLGQAVPTLSGQVARTIDPYQRTVKTDKNSWMPTDAQHFIKRQFNKIPFVSYLNEPRLDDYGQIPENGNHLTRILENMVSPGFIEKTSEDEVYKDVKRLYEETGEGSAVLNTRRNNFTIDGEKVYMKPEEFTKYRQLAGGMSYNMLQDLNSRDFYEDMDAYEQLDIVGDIYSYAKDTAKKETIGYELKGWQVKAAEYAASGGDALDYIIFRRRTMDLTGDVDKKGHTISGSVKKKVLEQIDSMDITKEQKDLLYNLKGYGQKELKDAPWH